MAVQFTLAECAWKTYLELGQLTVNVATAGSTTTIVDSKASNSGRTDQWKEGVAFIIEDSAGASAAPEGQYARISGYTDGSGTWALDAALTAVVAAGDTYGVAAGGRYPFRTMIEIINKAIRSLGDIVTFDTTTLDTANNKTEYTIDKDWKRKGPIRVDIQTRTGDSDDNRWYGVYNWEYIPAAPGSDGLMILSGDLPSDFDLRVAYLDQHPRLNSFADVIDEAIHPELAVAACVEKALSWQNRKLRGRNDHVKEEWNKARSDLDELIGDFHVDRPQRVSPRLNLPRNYSQQTYTGEVGKVNLGGRR